jgi:hypothetical protein
MKKNIQEQSAETNTSPEVFLIQALTNCFQIGNDGISQKYPWFKIDNSFVLLETKGLVKLKDGRFAIKGFKIKDLKTGEEFQDPKAGMQRKDPKTGILLKPYQDVYWFADKTVLNATTGNQKTWTPCPEITKTVGVAQDTSKLTPDQTQTVNFEKMKNAGWTDVRPPDPENWETNTKIPGYTLYRQKAFVNMSPNQIENIKTALKKYNHTFEVPIYDSAEWHFSMQPQYKKTLGTYISPEEAVVLGLTDLTTKIYPLPNKIGPKNKETIKTDIEKIKDAKRYLRQECQFAIENLYNNSELVTKKPRDFTPLIEPANIQSTKTTAVACIAQQGIDGFTPMRGYGFKTEEKIKQLIRNTGKFGLKQLFDSYKQDLRTTQRESVETKDLKKVIRENISKINKSKNASLLQEGKIINNRFNIITEGTTPKNKKDQKKVGKELFNEMIYLNKQGYSQELISEGLMDIFSSIFPKGVSEPIMQYFKEEGAKWLAGKFGLNPNSWLSSIVISAIGDVGIGEIPRLFSDCNFATKKISKAVAEGIVRKIQVEKFGDSAFYNLMRNTLVDALEATELATKLEEKLGTIICPLVSTLSGKMEGAADTMKQKALGAV